MFVRLLAKGRARLSPLIGSRSFSNIKIETKTEGLREKFTRYEVRLLFDEWLKSLWLAPNQWIHSTQDRSIRITRHFLPFWNINLQGSIQCSLSTKSNLPFRHDESYYSQKEWHSFPLEISDVTLKDTNIYAAEDFDRYHVQNLDVSFDGADLVDVDDKKSIIDKATIDRETAFKNAWVLALKPHLETMCLEEAKKVYPKFENPRIDSFHLNIISKQEHLLYYPVYIINYNYNYQFNYTCLFDGLTGQITGDRQYSLTKVTLATFLAFYPMIKIGLFAVGFFVDFLFAFELSSELSLSVALPIALVVAPCIGLYARSYPRLYRKEISNVQWKQDQSKAIQFTYTFQGFIQDQTRSASMEGEQQLKHSCRHSGPHSMIQSEEKKLPDSNSTAEKDGEPSIQR